MKKWQRKFLELHAINPLLDYPSQGFEDEIVELLTAIPRSFQTLHLVITSAWFLIWLQNTFSNYNPSNLSIISARPTEIEIFCAKKTFLVSTKKNIWNEKSRNLLSFRCYISFIPHDYYFICYRGNLPSRVSKDISFEEKQEIQLGNHSLLAYISFFSVQLSCRKINIWWMFAQFKAAAVSSPQSLQHSSSFFLMRFNILNSSAGRKDGEEKSQCHLVLNNSVVSRERKISIYRQLENRKREKLNN